MEKTFTPKHKPANKPCHQDRRDEDQGAENTADHANQNIQNELDELPEPPGPPEQQYIDHRDIEFPDDHHPEARQEQAEDQEEDQVATSDNFINSVIQEQQEFIRVLDQAENQLMLDEHFILVISDVCNRKTDEFYFYDFRDSQLVDMVPPFD